MPRFDFRCKKCSATFEAMLPFGAAEKPACPSCGSKATEKLITPPGIVFKGSGWYKTDSRSSSPAKKKQREEQKEKGESTATEHVKKEEQSSSPHDKK